MKKAFLCFGVLLILAGCSKAPLNITTTGLKDSYEKEEAAVFCLQNKGQEALTVWIGLERQVKNAWELCFVDLQSADAEDVKHVERLLGPEGSFCETWMISESAKSGKLIIPGKYRLIFTCHRPKDLVEGKPPAKVFYSEAFTLKRGK
ncbi:MAG: hypothetical protein WCI43_07525 [Candidatus Firestonebacteria bacterium]